MAELVPSVQCISDNTAMDVFEKKYGNPLENDGPREMWERPERPGGRRKLGEARNTSNELLFEEIIEG